MLPTIQYPKVKAPLFLSTTFLTFFIEIIEGHAIFLGEGAITQNIWKYQIQGNTYLVIACGV